MATLPIDGMSMPSWTDLMGRLGGASVVPPASEVLRGMETLKYKKTPVVVSGYHADVFDMDLPADRDRYCKTMMSLMPSIQNAQVAILRHELQPLSNRDGSTTWKRYLEWIDYKLNDTSTTTKRDGEDNSEHRKEEV